MSINIPAETPDESTNPISVEEFERLHPAMLGAIRKAVREEPARTVIGTVGDDRRSHLSSLDLRGIGIEVGRQLSARDMTTEVMGSILEHINQAADRLSTEIQELRSELIREHVETVGGGCHGSIHRIESLGEEGKPLAQGSHLESQRADTACDGPRPVPHQGDHRHPCGWAHHGQPHSEGHGQGEALFHRPVLGSHPAVVGSGGVMGVYEIRRRQLRNGSYTGGDYTSAVKAARLTYGLGESTISSHQRIYPEASSHTRDRSIPSQAHAASNPSSNWRRC